MRNFSEVFRIIRFRQTHGNFSSPIFTKRFVWWLRVGGPVCFKLFIQVSIVLQAFDDGLNIRSFRWLHLEIGMLDPLQQIIGSVAGIEASDGVAARRAILQMGLDDLNVRFG